MRVELETEYIQYAGACLARLHREAYLLCGDAHRADDVVQETLTSMYVGWASLRTVDNLDAYVRTMLVRTFLRERRRPWFRVRLGATVLARVGRDAPLDGQLRVLDAPGDAPRAVAVNSAGVVVVAESLYQGPVWLYHDGRYTALSGDEDVTPTAINTDGDVVGAVGREGVAGRDAVIWPADRPGEMRVLSGGPAVATGISDDGLIIGYEDADYGAPAYGTETGPRGLNHRPSRHGALPAPGWSPQLSAGVRPTRSGRVTSYGTSRRMSGPACPGPPNRDPNEPGPVVGDFLPLDVSETGVVVGGLSTENGRRPGDRPRRSSGATSVAARSVRLRGGLHGGHGHLRRRPHRGRVRLPHRDQERPIRR